MEFGRPLYPAIEETIVIMPSFLFLKWSSTDLIQFRVPKKLTLKTFSICSASISRSFLGSQVPVEKKQMSKSPKSFFIVLVTSKHFSLSFTSKG